MRQLATIQTIDEIIKHPNADKLDIARILGWVCVVKRDEYKVGEKTVFCEIDSILPPISKYGNPNSFDNVKERKYRIKTIRLRGMISQGICYKPVDVLPSDLIDAPVGTDVTEIIGVTKYDPDVYNYNENCAGMPRRLGNFPSHLVPKTDETRIQSLKKFLSSIKGIKIAGTIKLDGSSITCLWEGEKFLVCSRNNIVKAETTDDNKFSLGALNVGVEQKLTDYCKTHNRKLALQGELLGPGIQKNKYKLNEYTIRFFNCYDIDAKKKYCHNDLKSILKDLDLPMVPILFEDEILHDDIDQWVQRASSLIGNFTEGVMDEGIVVRPMEDIKIPIELWHDIDSTNISFKVINPEFLLKNDE